MSHNHWHGGITAFDNIPLEGKQRLAKIPIYIVIGDHAPARVDASRKFQKEMATISGQVTVDALPEAGIYGNGHTMMFEKNNKDHAPHDRLARGQRVQAEIAIGAAWTRNNSYGRQPDRSLGHAPCREPARRHEG